MQVEDWDAFDVFKLASLAGGRPLEAVTLTVLHRFDLIDKLKLPEKKLRNFLQVHLATNAAPVYNYQHGIER